MKNILTKQRELDYCMYMMLSSCFVKAICETPIQEQKLRLYYLEMRASEQISTESMCEKLINEQFKKQLPKELFNSTVKIKLIGHENDIKTTIVLESDNFTVRVNTTYALKKPQIMVQIKKFNL